MPETPPLATAPRYATGAGMVAIPGSEDARVQEQVEERRQHDTMSAALRDIQDLLGADEVVFFRFARGRDALQAWSWSTIDAPRPACFRLEWISLLHEVACGREPRVHATDGRDVLACAPVFGESVPLGAISAMNANGLELGADELLRRMPRYASLIGRIAELTEVRREATLETLRINAILAAVQHFQGARTSEDLGRSICEVARQVTRSDRAKLVRWRGSAGGEVEAVAGLVSDEGAGRHPVSADSLVGHVCSVGLAQVWEDARLALQVQPIYGSDDSASPSQSLGIFPLRHRETGVVGAIVVEGEEPGTVRIRAMRDLRLLGTFAAMSLETVWEIEEVTRRARTDLLTGLPNRRHLEERMQWVLDETDRFGGAASLIVVDLDHFKLVNDAYGHEAGDAVLRHVAQVIASSVRDVDLCARFGGEELVLLLPQTGRAGAMELAERLRGALADRPTTHAGQSIPITASFGVASYPTCVTRRDELFDAADRALYEAKRGGRDRVCAVAGEG